VYKVEGHGDIVTPDDLKTAKETECIICYTNVKNTILLPCRHFCVCNVCSESIKWHTNQCPICREQVTRYI